MRTSPKPSKGAEGGVFSFSESNKFTHMPAQFFQANYEHDLSDLVADMDDIDAAIKRVSSGLISSKTSEATSSNTGSWNSPTSSTCFLRFSSESAKST